MQILREILLKKKFSKRKVLSIIWSLRNKCKPQKDTKKKDDLEEYRYDF